MLFSAVVSTDSVRFAHIFYITRMYMYYDVFLISAVLRFVLQIRGKQCMLLLCCEFSCVSS